MQTLRPYQLNATDRLIPAALKAAPGPVRRVLVASPCGSGKTSVFCEQARRAAANGVRTLLVAHRRKLVRQMSERLLDFGVRFGVVMADLPDAGSEPWARHDPTAPVQVASRDTLASRMGRDGVPPADLLVLDEAHVSYPPAIESACGAKWVLGYTATPCRSDGSGLSAAYWGGLVTVTTAEELLGLDPPCLVPTAVYAPAGVAAKRRRGLRVRCSGDPVRQWLDHAEGLRTVTFCASVAESLAVRDAFRSVGARAEHLDASTPDAERERVIDALESGRLDVVSNFDIVGIGVDIPALECVQLLTTCASPVRYWQCVGRCQRPAPGKKRGVVLDHAAAYAQHGMPNVSPAWTLDERDSVQNRQRERMASDKQSVPHACGACGLVSAGTSTCPGCGRPLFQKKGKAVETGREPLALVGQDGGGPPADPRQRDWVKTLYFAAAKGMKCSQAGAVFKGKHGVWPDAAGVRPLYERHETGERVADVFPQYARRGGTA